MVHCNSVKLLLSMGEDETLKLLCDSVVMSLYCVVFVLCCVVFYVVHYISKCKQVYMTFRYFIVVIIIVTFYV